MAFDLNPFIADLKTQVVLAWPELSLADVYETEDISLIAWEDLAPPYAVLYASQFDRAGGWTLSDLPFEFPVDVFYVKLVKGPSTALITKCQDLLNRFWPHQPLTTATRTGILGFGPSKDLEPNRHFISVGSQRRAGVVRMQFLVVASNA